MRQRFKNLLLVLILATTLLACTKKEEVNILLDWSVNINHVGLYVAEQKGFFTDEGLKVNLVLPPSGTAIDLLMQKQGLLAISSTEELVYAQQNGITVKAVAALMQGNYSSFSSLASQNITSPRYFVGKRYAAWGSPIEEPIIKTLMTKDGITRPQPTLLNLPTQADINALKLGIADYIWTFYHTDGVAAKLMGESLNYINLVDFDKRLNYYTPIFISSNEQINNDLATIKKLLRAIEKGYRYAMANSTEAVDILAKYAPTTNKELWREGLKASKAMFFKDDTFGVMKEEVFTGYIDWLKEYNLLAKPVEAKDLFTNATFN